jgi:hypothetical protein
MYCFDITKNDVFGAFMVGTFSFLLLVQRIASVLNYSLKKHAQIFIKIKFLKKGL